MTSNHELLELIAKARHMGAIVNVTHDQVAHIVEGREVIDSVQVIGLKGCGPHAMPPIAAAERLRELTATSTH